MSPGPPEPLDRRTLLRRAAIGGAAIWATPMMHSVASAQAAPSCGPGHAGRLDWDTFATGSLFTSALVGTINIGVAVSGVTNTSLLPDNRRVLAGPAGNINQKHLRFEMVPSNGTAANGSRQTVTWTFSSPVTNVVFTFFDIDNVTNSWGDRLVMNTTGFTFSIPPGGTVIGNGTNGNRFRNSLTNNNLPATDNRGNLTIRYAGPLTTFNFTYRNEVNSGGGNQLISMSDITFNC
jgi:hypothetical protein